MSTALPRKTVIVALALFYYCNLLAQADSWSLRKPFGYGPLVSADGVAFSMDGKAYVGLGYTGETQKDLWEYDTAQKAWSQKAAFPGVVRVGAAYFTIGNTGYVVTGFGQFVQRTKEVWAYHADINSWEAKRNFPGTARSNAVAFSIAGKGYFGGGYNENSLSDFWQYDPISDAWLQKADLPRNNVSGAAFSINENGYLLIANELWMYDPGMNRWTQKSTYPGSVLSNRVALTINGKGYVGIGQSSEFWQYDPHSDLWQQQPDYPGELVSRGYLGFTIASQGYIAGDWLWTYNPKSKLWNREAQLGAMGRFAAAGFRIGDKGYIGTGAFSLTNQKDFWEYDPLTDTWTQKANFPGTARYGAVGFAVEAKGYIGLGYDGVDTRISYPKDIWQYDPLKNCWTRMSDFPGKPRQRAVAVTINGKGFLGTGFFQSEDFVTTEMLTDFWQYNTETDSWLRKADFGGGGRMEAAAFAIGSKCYMGTGFITNGTAKEDFWEYDLTQDKWNQKANYPGGAREGAVAFAIGNRGFLGLGFSTAGRENEFWKYDPFSDSWERKRDFPGGIRRMAVAFAIGRKGYVGTGISNGPIFNNDFWEYSSDNEPPVANGWLMKYVTPTSVLMNGWGSHDPEGSVIRFSWTKTSGPSSYSILYPNSSTPVISNLVNGTYTFRLTVTDDIGATATSDVTFTIKYNLPPIANGWVMKYYSPISVLMNAWGSYDPEGGPVKFWWEKISGPASFTMLYQNASTPVISNLVVGIYQFQLTVTDDQGAQAKDTVTLNIQSLSSTQVRTSLQENAFNAMTNLVVYPNPVQDVLNVKWTNAFTGNATLTVTDVLGKIIQKTEVTKKAFDYTTSLRLQGLKPGLYHLYINQGNKKLTTTHFVKL